MRFALRTTFLLALLAIGSVAVSHAAEVAATVAELEGKALALDTNNASRRLAEGQPVYSAETVYTLGKARIVLRFADDSKYELGPGTRLRIEDYRYRNDPEQDFAATRILKGFFRYVSGSIARRRPRNTSIGVSVATIGIRGTHVIGEVTETSARIGLLPPEDGDHPSAIEVSNAYGSVNLDTPGFETVIPDATSPPSPPRPMDTRAMTRNLRAVQTMRRAIAPRLPPRMP